MSLRIDFAMLSRNQANVVAENLLANEPRALPPRVPSFLRTAQSARLDQWREWQLFQQVQRKMLNGWRWNTAFAVYPVVVTAIWVSLAIHSLSGWYTVVFIWAIAVPYCVRLVLVRRGLARLAREHLESHL